MAETTYLLGAGINRSIEGLDGCQPPLALDFFQQIMRHPRLSAYCTLEVMEPLFTFIEQYWHLDKSKLKNVDFDLEECFSFLELQRREAYAKEDVDMFTGASKLENLLSQILLDYLSECEIWFFNSTEFRSFGELIFHERAAVLTFNYDTILEAAIESASPPTPQKDVVTALLSKDANDGFIREEEIAYSSHEWNPYLAYKVNFDEVALRTPGLIRMVDGPRYYAHAADKITSPSFLKLHGSLGWFYHTGYRVDGIQLDGEQGLQVGKSLLRRTSHRIGPPEIDYSSAEILLPLILTPVLNKPYEQHPVFRKIWEEARVELHTCKKLIVGGYSFPPTDFHVRRLLREVFCERGPEQLYIINPDTAVVSIVKNLCNYQRPVVVCRNLDEFLSIGV